MKKSFEILECVEIKNLALWFKKQKTLIIADLHIGFEEALNKEGVLVPRFQFKDLEKELKKVLEETKPEIIIVNGDLKHEFGGISEQEWRETLKILELLEKNSEKVILIKGNHDTILGPIANKKNVALNDYCVVGNVYISHGDKIPKNSDFKKSEFVIIAHEHPAISLREGGKVETFKCFLKGKYKNKTLVVMPSFHFVIEGSDVLREKMLSPFLQKNNLGNFRVFIVSNAGLYDFGFLTSLR